MSVAMHIQFHPVVFLPGAYTHLVRTVSGMTLRYGRPRAAAAGTVSVMSVFKFTNLYSMKSCNAGVVALVSRARDAYAVIECRESLQIL